MQDIQQRIQAWLDGPYDEKTKAEIRAQLQKNPASLNDAFYTDLTFGTAGLRGIMGVGTNRMNRYTVGIATQGLANYIRKQPNNASAKGVFIGFDSRHHSEEFAQETARVLAGNGIAVYLLKELRPVPFVSFGCRHQKCIAGIMITASHNPAEYNGYKVFWSDGAQVVSPHDAGIMKEVHAIRSFADVKHAELNSPLIHRVDSGLDQDYVAAIRPLQHRPAANQQSGHALHIVYTSLHGTGITLAPLALKDWGFTSLHFVTEQIKPDGDFPTVKFPNPEYKEALQLGIDHLLKTRSDILIANDPDADRLGVVALHQNKPVILTGNEVAAICVEYLCQHDQGMPKGAFVTTIVSTELIPVIAKAHGHPCFEVLTGFKYIGEKIHLWETSKPSYRFLFGAEESYGYLLGTVARDKDAIVSSCLISEIANSAKEKKKTLVDLLHEIYRKYGIFRERQEPISFDPGEAGMEKIRSIMQKLRQTPLKRDVVSIEDYKTLEKISFPSRQKEFLTLPHSDVLVFRFKDGSKLIVRPSGTEPKIKLYCSVHETTFSTVDAGLKTADAKLDALIRSIRDELKI